MSLYLLLLCCAPLSIVSLSPHIVMILADDYGYNDIGYHNKDIITPNIDNLARQGVILEQSYVQPVCTPTRYSLAEYSTM